MRSNGSCVCAARSSSSLYSSSSHSLCSVLRGSLSWTGIATFDRSFPMLFFRMCHRLMLLVLGLGEGRHDRRCSREQPFSTNPDKEWCRWSVLRCLENWIQNNYASNQRCCFHTISNKLKTFRKISISMTCGILTCIESLVHCLVAEVIHGHIVTDVTDIWVIFGSLVGNRTLSLQLFASDKINIS